MTTKAHENMYGVIAPEIERQVADDSDRDNLLSQETVPGTTRSIWMDESIIAERTADKTEQNEGKTKRNIWSRQCPCGDARAKTMALTG
jgi:hypothetical protein